MAKSTFARTFGQDLMRGEHKVGGGMGRQETIDYQSGGTLMAPPSSHPRYYEQKSRAENDLGRKLTNEEFEADYWNPPQDSPLSSGTSIFDPVLCEIAYRWFCPKDGKVLDPFAGGSVRGIVAAVLGRHYTGVDLRSEQIEANTAQAEMIVPENMPTWICGDSNTSLPDDKFDFLFSCPPYGDLEVYSDNPLDISTMGYSDFIQVYRSIIRQCVGRLKDNRFACFVVGDIRDKKGVYRNFVSDTISAFQDCGAYLYNEAILVTSVGSLPIRVGKPFESSRKLGKTHQNVLVFIKGDPKQATEACGPVDVSIGDIAGEFGEVYESTGDNGA